MNFPAAEYHLSWDNFQMLKDPKTSRDIEVIMA